MSLTISAGQVADLIQNASQFASYSSTGPITITGEISYSEANSLNSVDATSITATVTETSITNLSGIAVDNASRSGLNSFTFTVTDTSATAAELTSVQTLTSVAVNAGNITAIEGSSSTDLATLFTGTVPTNIATVPITVNDTTIDAATLNTIEGYSTGATTTTATTIEGSAEDIVTAFADADIDHSTVTAATVTGSTVAASDLNTIESVITGVTTVSGATTLTGTFAQVDETMDHNNLDGDNGGATPERISGLDNVNVTLTSTTVAVDGALGPTAANVETLIGKIGTGNVTATISDTGITSFLDANGDPRITGTGHSLTITLVDDAFTAAQVAAVNDLDATTTVNITLTPAGGADSPTLTGTATELAAYLASTGIDNTGSEATVLVSDASITVTELNAITDNTSGTVTATLSNNDIADLEGITGTGNALTITLVELSQEASKLNTLSDLTNAGLITATTVTSVSGTASEVEDLYSNNLAKFVAGDLVGAGVSVTLSDTALDADLLMAIDAIAGGTIDVSAATSISGTSANVTAAFAAAAADISGLATTIPVTITGETNGVVDAANLMTIAGTAINGTGGQTTGLVTVASDATSISGTLANVSAAFLAENPALTTTSAHISGVNGLDLTFTGGGGAFAGNAGTALTIAELQDFEGLGYTYGTITANVETVADITTLTAADPAFGTGNDLDFEFSDATVTATNLLALDAITSGVITASSAVANQPAITGSVSDVKSVYALTTAIGGIDDSAITLSDTGNVSALDLISINDDTTGQVDATNITRITGDVSDIITVLNTADAALTGKGLVTQTISITDATIAAADLTTIISTGATGAGLTVGSIEILATTLSGTANEIAVITGGAGVASLTAYVANNAGTTVTGADNLAFDVSETVDISTAIGPAGQTTGVVTVDVTDDAGGGALNTAVTGILTVISAAGFDETSNIFNFTITDATVAASDIITLEGLTQGTITLDTNGATAGGGPLITGNISNINSVITNSSISGYGDSAITVLGGLNVSQLEDITAITSGTVTAVVTDNDMATLSGITSTGNNLSLTVTDATVVATELTALDAKTTGTLTVSAANTVTGNYTDVAAVLNATTITGRNAVSVTISDSISVANANTTDGLTTGVITASITETDLDTLATGAGILTDTNANNVYTITVDKQTEEDADPATTTLNETISAANLNTLNGLTAGVITVTAPTISGAYADIDAAFTANTAAEITGLETKAVTITDASGITQTEAEAAQDLTSGVVTATIINGDIESIDAPGDANFDQGTGVNAIQTGNATITAGAAAAGDLITVTAAAVSQGVATTYATGDLFALDEANVVTVGGGTGATFDITTDGAGAYTVALTAGGQNYDAGDTITILGAALGGGGDLVITLAAGSLANTRTVEANTGTYSGVAATGGSGTGATFDVVVASDGSITSVAVNSAGTGYASGETLTIAGELIGGDGTNDDISFQTTAIGFNNIADFLAQDANSNYDIESGNAFSITFDDANIAAADLIQADSMTSGLITLAGTSITGTTADLISVYESANATTPGIAGIGAYALTVQNPAASDGSLSANDLVTLTTAATGTTGVVTIDTTLTDAASVATSLSGTYADVHTILTLDKTLTQAEIDAEQLAGTAAGSETGVLAANNTIAGIIDGTNAGVAIPVTLTDTSNTVAEVNDIVDNYTGIGVVTATITETDMATLQPTAVAGSGLTATAGAYTITIDDASVDAGALNTLNTLTTEDITVSSTTLTGVLTAGGAVDTALGATGFIGLDSIAVTSDQGTNSVAEVNNISSQTTGVVTASITETDLTTLDTITGTGNAYTITVSGTTAADASIDAATLNVLDGKTTVDVAVTATNITGFLSDIKAAYDANGDTISGLGNETITVSDTGTISSQDLNDLNDLTTGVVTVSAVTTISGTLAEIVDSYSADNISGVITGLSNEAITITDTGSVSAADLITVTTAATGTTGTVTANDVTAVSGTYSDITSAYAAGIEGLGEEAITATDSVTVAEANALDLLTSGVITADISTDDIDALDDLTGTGNAYTITVADSSVSAAKLTALNAKTTVNVIVSSATVTGTATEIDAAYDASGFTGLNSEALTVNSGTASVSEVNTLGGHTTGVVTATVTEGDMTTLAGITETGNALSVTVTDTTVSATALTALDGKTTVAVDASSVTTLTGTETEQLAAYAAHRDGTITGLDSSFDAASYLASHSDLLRTYTKASVKSYFFDFGIAEGRALDTFDEATYLASYTDLLAYFGTDTSDVTTHYVDFGYGEGRSTDAFDELGYIASYADLIEYIGVDASTAVTHYINFGYGEGRSVTFDAESYLDANADLKAFIQDDLELAKKHYILHGADEGRLLA